MIQEILLNLYNNKSRDWILNLDDAEIPSNIVILRFMNSNNSLIHITKYLNYYSFNIEPRHFLFLAWSLIPKNTRYNLNYLKKIEYEDDMKIALDKIKKYLDISDNDMRHIKNKIIDIINKDKQFWFKKIGVKQSDYEKMGVYYEQEEESKDIKKGLSKWGF